MSWYDQQMTATMGGSGAVSRPSMAGGSFVAEHGGQGTQPGNRGQGYSGGMGMTFVQWVRTLSPAQRLHYQRTGGLTGKRFVNVAPSLGITPIRTGTGGGFTWWQKQLIGIGEWAAVTTFGMAIGGAVGHLVGYGPGLGATATAEASIGLGLTAGATGYYAAEYSPEGSNEARLLGSIAFTTLFMGLYNLGNLGSGITAPTAPTLPEIFGGPVLTPGTPTRAAVDSAIQTGADIIRSGFKEPDWEWFMDIYN